MTSSDDEYKGYFIPKGTVVLGSIWQVVCHALSSTTLEPTYVQGNPSQL
jgi:hypothetical protein